MKRLGYTPIAVITDTWEHARFLNKNFNAEFGIVALEKFCKLEPNAMNAEERDFCRPNTYADFVENIIQILGPDIEFIMSIMAGFAKTFEAQGGKAKYMLSIGDSVVYSLEKCLNRQLHTEEIEAFDEVFNAICREICKHLTGAPASPVWKPHTARSKETAMMKDAAKGPEAKVGEQPASSKVEVEKEHVRIHIETKAKVVGLPSLGRIFGKRHSNGSSSGSVGVDRMAL